MCLVTEAQNTAGARIEAERPTATQTFWLMGSWKVGRISTFLSNNCVSDEAHFWLNGMQISEIVDFGVKISQKNCKS